MTAAGCLLVVLGGCSEAVEIDVPDLAAADAKKCAALVDALPDTLIGELRRPVVPDDAPGAAWGDDGSEPIVLTCGVGEPAGYDQFAHCIEFAGVGWFVPEEELADIDHGAIATALTHAPRVEVQIPAGQRTAGVDGVLADVGKAVADTLPKRAPCR